MPDTSLIPLWRKINQEFLARLQRQEAPSMVCLTLIYLHYHDVDNEPAKLADALGIPRQSMTPTLDYMETHKLADRVPHPKDRRRKQVVLTRKGQQFARKLIDDLLWLESYALSSVNAPEQNRLRHFLTAYADALTEGNTLQPTSPDQRKPKP